MNAVISNIAVADAKDIECACAICTSYCRNNPGWMLPDEAARAIAEGFAEQLMLDWWEADEKTAYEKSYLLCPASLGSERGYAPDPDWLTLMLGWNKGQCTFLADDKCTIHASGFKPRECRAAHHTRTREDSHAVRIALVHAWDSSHGRDLIARWRSLVGLQE